MAPIHSSQEFVRALKSTLDPPVPEGPLKVEIATQAWEDASFYVPRKAEIIVDWILGKFLKDKSKAPSSNPILDFRLWHLLHGVISTDVALLSSHTRPSKTWLATLLHRISIAPILVTFFALLEGLDSQMRERLSQVVSSCLSIVWPLAVQKMGTEIFLECFGSFLPVVQWCEHDEGLVRIGVNVVSSYKDSFYHSPNKKKIYHAFLHTHLHHWLESAVLEISLETKSLLELIYNAGAETLFNLDILRHTHDSKSEDPLFDAMKAISILNTRVLLCLPRLFTSYVHVLRKHRGALFSQGSNQRPGVATEELQASGMRFFVSCESLLNVVELDAQRWSIKVDLLHLVNHEGMYNRNQVDVSVLHRTIESALEILGTAWNEEETEITTYVIESLTTLARVDYDLISYALPDILLKVLLARSRQSFITFLDVLVDYHSKTRTMNVFLGHILPALSYQHIQGIGQAMRDVYQMSHSGPLLDTIFLAHLSKAIQIFLPGAQIHSTVEIFLVHLKDTLAEFHNAGENDQADYEEGPRKKRKVEVNATSLHSDASAISFSLSARIASVVLSSLAMQSIPQATQDDVGQRLSDLRNSFIHHKLRKAFKIIRKRAGSVVWSSQIVATASLRLLYALEISHSSFREMSDDSKLWKNVSDSLLDDGLLPELTVEILRALLSQPSSHQNEGQFQVYFDQVLLYIDRCFSAGVSWSGRSHHLTLEGQGRAKGPLALLHIIFEKWLPLIESMASRPQLEKLIRVVMSVDVTDYSELFAISGLHAQSLLGKTLRSANFWEFHRIRAVLLEYLNEATSILDDSTGLSSVSELSSVIAVYRLLLLLPVEYMPRSSRGDFIKRGLVADDHFSHSSVDSDHASTYVDQSLTILRMFLKRAVTHVSYVEQSQAENMYKYLEHLLMVQNFSLQPSAAYISVTVDLIEAHLRELFKVPEKMSIKAVQAILRLFSQSDLGSSSPWTFDIDCQSIIRMLDFLATAFSFSNFSHEVQVSLREFYQHLSKLILPRVPTAQSDVASTDIARQCNLLKLWCSLLSFGRWLGLIDMPRPREIIRLKTVGMSMLASSPAPDGRDGIRVASFAILLQELHYCGEDRLSHLETVIATYIIHHRVIDIANRQQIDDHFSKACGALSPSDFSHALDFIYESLTSSQTSTQDLIPLIQLAMILLRDHPPNTLKPIQHFATRCVAIFADRSIFTDGTVPLRVHVLEFVARHCSDRSAGLRMVDLGSIWALLSIFLSGSRIHDDDTAVTIFHKCVTIIGALVRLRRDLLTPALPHLATILQQLIWSMRRVRPHIGAKQTMLVTDTQPRYINAKSPLGPEEAKLLARLLEMLASKTTVRINATNTNAQKAESLAKPFSKHAPYVLKAYIEAMNDPLGIIPSSLRKELQNGLYALCGMMKDYSRNAMMVSALDAGGKATMKVLWKDYEKQKYIGKG